jgi:hypothetical protein
LRKLLLQRNNIFFKVVLESCFSVLGFNFGYRRAGMKTENKPNNKISFSKNVKELIFLFYQYLSKYSIRFFCFCGVICSANYFTRRATNASAESFNAKIKAFRSQFRGVQDIPFFIFRLEKLFA